MRHGQQRSHQPHGARRRHGGEQGRGVNAADTAWVLGCAALVMFMTPGLALFYGGMLRAKSVPNTMALTVACLAVVSVIWVAFGYSLAFGPDAGGLGLIALWVTVVYPRRRPARWPAPARPRRPCVLALLVKALFAVRHP